MRIGGFSALIVAAHLAAGVSAGAEPEQPGPIAVVVGAKSPIEGVTLDALRELYLRRRRVWPDGSRVIPINLPADSKVRQAFSRRVLGRPPEDLAAYWNRRYFEGILPPLVLRSPGAVCAYLAVEPSGIGYVPVGYVDAAACRVVLVLHEPRQ